MKKLQYVPNVLKYLKKKWRNILEKLLNRKYKCQGYPDDDGKVITAPGHQDEFIMYWTNIYNRSKFKKIRCDACQRAYRAVASAQRSRLRRLGGSKNMIDQLSVPELEKLLANPEAKYRSVIRRLIDQKKPIKFGD